MLNLSRGGIDDRRGEGDQIRRQMGRPGLDERAPGPDNIERRLISFPGRKTKATPAPSHGGAPRARLLRAKDGRRSDGVVQSGEIGPPNSIPWDISAALRESAPPVNYPARLSRKSLPRKDTSDVSLCLASYAHRYVTLLGN